MTELVTSIRKIERWRSMPKILNQLGVEHKRGANFWLRNEGRLEYIWHDFKVKAREIREQIYPRKVGDSAEGATAFNRLYLRVERMFQRHGVAPIDRIAQERRMEALRALPKPKVSLPRRRRSSAATWRKKERKLHPVLVRTREQERYRKRKAAGEFNTPEARARFMLRKERYEATHPVAVKAANKRKYASRKRRGCDRRGTFAYEQRLARNRIYRALNADRVKEWRNASYRRVQDKKKHEQLEIAA